MDERITGMPFVSKAQRRFLYSRHPEIAKRWAAHTPKGTKLPEHIEKTASGLIFEGFIIEMEKTASFKKWIATGLLGGALTGAPGLAKAETVASRVFKNPTVSGAFWKQYEVSRAAREVAAKKGIDLAKYNPAIGSEAIRTAKPGVKGYKVVPSVHPETRVTQVGNPGVEADKRSLMDKAIDAKKELETKLGIKMKRGGNIEKNIGGLDITGGPKGLQEVSKRFGNARAYVQPRSKQIGVGYGFNF